jgi:hypothetical protein
MILSAPDFYLKLYYGNDVPVVPSVVNEPSEN